MTLDALSQEYGQAAKEVRARMLALQKESLRTSDPVARQQIRQRILALQPLYRDTREVSRITANYYTRAEKRSRHYESNLLPPSPCVSSQAVSAPCTSPAPDSTPAGDDAPVL